MNKKDDEEVEDVVAVIRSWEFECPKCGEFTPLGGLPEKFLNKVKKCKHCGQKAKVWTAERY